MIDLPTAALIASTIGNAVTAIDKMYRGYADFFKKKTPNIHAPPPDFSIQNSTAEGAVVATSLHTGANSQKVTYEELRSKLNPNDRAYVETLSQALESYEKQWQAAYLAKSMASGMDVGRLDAQLAYLSKQIAEPLLRVLEFVERMGLWLDDHYLAARDIAKEYVKAN